MSFSLNLRPTQRAFAQAIMFWPAHELQKSTREITPRAFGCMNADDGLNRLHCLQNCMPSGGFLVILQFLPRAKRALVPSCFDVAKRICRLTTRPIRNRTHVNALLSTKLLKFALRLDRISRADFFGECEREFLPHPRNGCCAHFTRSLRWRWKAMCAFILPPFSVDVVVNRLHFLFAGIRNFSHGWKPLAYPLDASSRICHALDDAFWVLT